MTYFANIFSSLVLAKALMYMDLSEGKFVAEYLVSTSSKSSELPKRNPVTKTIRIRFGWTLKNAKHLGRNHAIAMKIIRSYTEIQ